MSKTLLLKNQLAEARGEIPQGTAAQVTFAAIAQSGVEAALEGYYGKKAVDEAFDKASDARQEQRAMDINDELLADVAPILRNHKATHTTSDFASAMVTLRTRRIRETYEAGESRWRDFASVTTTPDFKPIRAMRFSGIPELRLRPEGKDVEYAPLLDVAQDGYRVANYELAVLYTWEMSKNDDIGAFTKQLEQMGKGAKLTEDLTVLTAIKDGVTRTALTAGAGVPTIDRMIEMEEKLAARTFTNGQPDPVTGVAPSHEYGFRLSDVIFGTRQRQYINTILNTQFTNFQGGTPNVMAGAFTPHLEPMWARVLGTDYIGYDNNVDWLEVAFLEGFQNGPKTYTQIPDVEEWPDEGSFDNHSVAVKLGHVVGAKVVAPEAVIRVEGQA